MDCSSRDKFDQCLNALKQTWDAVEKATTGTTLPKFFAWFCKTQVTDLKQSLMLPIRQDAGLGMEHFYNNASECINRRLKSQSKMKKTKHP